jgi:hypothetical protein
MTLSDESRTAGEAVRLYRDKELSTRQVAEQLGVGDRKVRGWLRDAGVTRRRGPRPSIDPAAVRAARKKRKEPWSQVAADLGISETGAKKAYRRGYGGDSGLIDRHAHLTGAQKAELGHAWDCVPPPPHGGHGHSRECAEGRRVRDMLRHYAQAGVTLRELANVLGISDTRVGEIIRDT